MALANTGVWEIRTTGSDSSGGGFNSAAAGTDYSQQNSPQVVINNSTITATTTGANSNTLTFTAGYTPSAADVGNYVQLTGGTNINAGIYEITAQTSTTWTLTGATNATTAGGAGSAITGNMGGALASLGKAFQFFIGGQQVYQQAGTYSITSASTNVSGGCVSMPTGSNTTMSRIIGYTASRADAGTSTRPVNQASGIATFTVITTGTECAVENIEIDCAGLTTSKGISGTTFGKAYRCLVRNHTSNAFNGLKCHFCEATGGSGTSFSACDSFYCTAIANTGNVAVFAPGAGNNVIGCAAVNNTGGTSTHGFSFASNGGHADHCTAYGNAGCGFSCLGTSTAPFMFTNCLAVNNSGSGFQTTVSSDMARAYGCAGYNNTGGINNGLTGSIVSLSGDPFVNAAGLNFALNATASAGATCRAGGVPGVVGSSSGRELNGLSTNAYPDIGAAQHADTPSGGPPASRIVSPSIQIVF